MSSAQLTVCQADMLDRLAKGKYFLAGAYRSEDCAARKTVIRHLFQAGLVRTSATPARWEITEAGREALAAWRVANKALLDERRKNLWARFRAGKTNDKNKGECDVVS